MKKQLIRVAVVLLVLAATESSAQSTPCSSSPQYSAFDFWVGDWDVYAGGNQVGTNSIVKLEAGCALLETWTGAGGSTGVSLNYFNPVTDEWRQLWVSAGEYAIDISGGLVNDAMVLTGELYNYGSGDTYAFRGTWTPNGDGSVRQFFEQVNPQTHAWEPWFDGCYVPQE